MPLIITEGLGPDSGGGGGSPLTVASVSASLDQVQVILSSSGLLIGAATIPSNWTISGGGAAMTVTAVGIAGDTITLTTTEGTTGFSYTLSIPQGIVDSSNGNPCVGAFSQSFTGVGSSPTLASARAVDARILELSFSKPVTAFEATNPSNYSIPGLQVTAVTELTSSMYRLTTSQQTEGTVYTVTASNIHDLVGNPI